MNRPQSGGAAPTSGPPGHPVSGQARPPYPPVPRPVSGAQARGAASVPRAQQPYRHPSAPPMQHQPMPGGQQPNGSGGRQVLILLAVVLGLLVLLCSGVIAFLLKSGDITAMRDQGPRSTVVHAGAADQPAPAASYRLMQAAAPGSLNHATEGRQTL